MHVAAFVVRCFVAVADSCELGAGQLANCKDETLNKQQLLLGLIIDFDAGPLE